jgi:hypothetical protein
MCVRNPVPDFMIAVVSGALGAVATGSSAVDSDGRTA